MDINASAEIETELFEIASRITMSREENLAMFALAQRMQRQTRIEIDTKEIAESIRISEKDLIHALNHLRMKGIYSLDSRKKPKLVIRNRVYV